MFVELKMFTKFNVLYIWINVLSCLGNLIVARTMCFYCNGSHQGISISSSPRQAIFGNVISRFSVFVFFVGLAYMQVFQVSPPLSYPENFPGYFTDVNRYLTYILFGDFSGHFLHFKSVIFCNLSSLYRSCEVHCNSSSQIINVI